MRRQEEHGRNFNRRSSEAYKHDGRNQNRDFDRSAGSARFRDSAMDHDFDLRESSRDAGRNSSSSNYLSERDDDRGFSRAGRGWGNGSRNSSEFERSDRMSHSRGFERDQFDRDMDLQDSSRADYSGYRSEDRGHFGKGPQGYRRSDERIKEEVCEALYRSYEVDASNIDVSVKDGCVILKGSVESRDAKRVAESCVEDLSGVNDVQNELKVNREGGLSDNRQSERNVRNISNQSNLS